MSRRGRLRAAQQPKAAPSDRRPDDAPNGASGGVSGLAPRRRSVNNRLAPSIRGSRRSREARWRAFDALPEGVADAIRESRSTICPVAALRLVASSGRSADAVARFIVARAAWTDWRVLASDFGEASATLLRPDAPRRKPSLRRWRDR